MSALHQTGRPFSWATSFLLLLLCAAMGTSLWFLGRAPRLQKEALRNRSQQDAIAPLSVRTVRVTAAEREAKVLMPGTCAPFQTTLIFAKSTGFLRKYHVDLGDKVALNQLLAEIDAPETDEELRVAKARLDEASANVGLIQQTARRQATLADAGVVSVQSADDARAQVNSVSASLLTRRAEMQRLATFKQFQRIHAPFAGVITRRNTELGALVGPQTGVGATALFELSQIDMLRVYVDVPQSIAPDMQEGTEAWVFLPGREAQGISGVIKRTSRVLDQGSRTLRVEVHIAGNGSVLSGSYVNVRFRYTRNQVPLIVPANAIIVRKEGFLLATVLREKSPEADVKRIVLKKILIGRDLGTHLEIRDGLSADDEIVINPPDTLNDRMIVRVMSEPSTR